MARTFTTTNSSSAKNMLLAFGLVLFLALSFKLTGELTGDTTNISQADAVVSSLQTPNMPTSQASAPE